MSSYTNAQGLRISVPDSAPEPTPEPAAEMVATGSPSGGGGGRLRQWVAGHAVIAAVLVTLVFAGGAAAAWITYLQTATGTATGKIDSNSQVTKFTFTPDGSVTPTDVDPCTAGAGSGCTGGTPGTIPFVMTNNTAGTVNLLSISAVLTTSDDGPDNCKSHLFILSGLPSTGNFGSGASIPHGVLSYVADPSLPTGCSAATVTATFSGTTN